MTLENVLNEFPLPIYEWKEKMPQDSPAALIDSGECSAVLLNYRHRFTSDELKVCLAHEEGHYRTGATHRLSSPLDLISQHEYKANAYAYQKLIPMNELMERISSGARTIWELSDLFGVPVQFLVDAVTYYVHHDQSFCDFVEGLKLSDD